MKWIDNYIEFKTNKTCGNCPKCGSNDVKVQEIQCGTRNSVTLSCGKCGDFAHFDEVATQN